MSPGAPAWLALIQLVRDDVKRASYACDVVCIKVVHHETAGTRQVSGVCRLEPREPLPGEPRDVTATVDLTAPLRHKVPRLQLIDKS